MKATYGTTQTTILPTAEEWNKELSAPTTATDAIAEKLKEIEAGATLKPFGELELAVGKLATTSGAPTAAGKLNEQVAAVRKVIKDRETLMGRVEQLLSDQTGWPAKCLCAELYTANDKPWGENKGISGLLEQECRLTSGWAMSAPTDFDEFCEKGEADANCVTQWPKLTTKARIPFESRRITWPPAWSETPWRKGLYCHSSAAIAAWAMNANRTQLSDKLGLTIKSIDIVQQMPKTTGTMSHWWVFVNRPDELTLSTGAKPVATADQWSGFELTGGFVVDIWGALWLDQQGHATTWASSSTASTRKAAQDEPFIQIEDMSAEKARLHIRKLYGQTASAGKGGSGL